MTTTAMSTEPSRLDASTEPGGKAGAHRYVPALDGLRALAVLAVMAYHADVVRTPGGFLGVDLFFVLSGFLITSLLVAEHRRTSSVGLRSFWARRARRLLPALFGVLAWVTLYIRFWADPSVRESLRAEELATLGYVANWWFIVEKTSYFEQFLAPSPLRHMWSLGIEEQWYLLWPLVFVLATRWGAWRRWLPAVLVVGAIGSAILMAVLAEGQLDPSRAYYGTDARVQGLLLGAAAAVFLQHRPPAWRVEWRRAATVAAWGGAVVLAGMVAFVDDADRWMYDGGFLLAAAAALVLVVGAWLPGPPTRLQRALTCAPLPAVGRISYGLYLWHWPIFVFMTAERTGLEGSTLLAARVGVTFAVAALSYRLIEGPIRFSSMTSRQLTLVGAAAGLVGIVLAVVLVTAPGSDQPSASAGGVVTQPTVVGAPRVLLVGDSVAGSLGRGLPDGTRVSLTTASYPGCGLVRGDPVGDDGVAKSQGCESAWTTMEEAVDDHHPDVSIVLIGAWEAYDHRVGDETLEVGSQAYADHIASELDDLVALLSADGGSVIVLTPPCYQPRIGTNAAAASDGVYAPERLRWLAEVFRSYGESRADVTLGDLSHLVCPGGTYQRQLDGTELHVDGVHYTPDGAALVWQWLMPLITEASARSTASAPPRTPAAEG